MQHSGNKTANTNTSTQKSADCCGNNGGCGSGCGYSNKSNSAAVHSGSAGAFYGIGFVGALIYWFQAASGFGSYLTAILKALVWPAYIAYNLLASFYGQVQ